MSRLSSVAGGFAVELSGRFPVLGGSSVRFYYLLGVKFGCSSVTYLYKHAVGVVCGQHSLIVREVRLGVSSSLRAFVGTC